MASKRWRGRGRWSGRGFGAQGRDPAIGLDCVGLALIALMASTRARCATIIG